MRTGWRTHGQILSHRKIEKTGVTLKMDYPADASDNRIALMVATGESGSCVFAKGDAPTLIQNDALIDMSDLIDEYGPNIKNCMEMSTKICVIPVMIHLFTNLCSDKVQGRNIGNIRDKQLRWGGIAGKRYQIPYTLDEYTQMIRDYGKISHY